VSACIAEEGVKPGQLRAHTATHPLAEAEYGAVGNSVADTSSFLDATENAGAMQNA
jgi:hypothetical protein